MVDLFMYRDPEQKKVASAEDEVPAEAEEGAEGEETAAVAKAFEGEDGEDDEEDGEQWGAGAKDETYAK